MSTIDWARLVQQGRAKAVGIPWSDKEIKARQEGVPAEAIREGVLTMEEYEDMDAKIMTDEERMNEAQVRAIELGIEFDSEAVEVSTLEKLIEDKELDLKTNSEENKVKAATGTNANTKWENMDYKDLMKCAKDLKYEHEGRGVPSKKALLEFLNKK